MAGESPLVGDNFVIQRELMEIKGMGKERTGERKKQRDAERESKTNKKETERNKKLPL